MATTTAATPPSREKLLATAMGFLDVNEGLSPGDPFPHERIIRNRTADFSQHVMPTSLGMGPFTNDQLRAFMPSYFPGIKNVVFRLFPNGREPVIDIDTRTVALHCQFAGDTDCGPYDSEYIFTMKMDPTGEHIEYMWEFGHSEKVLEWQTRLKKHAEEKEKAGKEE